MLILKNTATKNAQIFQLGIRKQDGTLECGNDRWFLLLTNIIKSGTYQLRYAMPENE
jgi:hypothetical protein